MTSKELQEKYPDILGECYLGIGDGWLPIIDELCSKLTQEGSPIKAVQVKEKFGGLRFYTNTATRTQSALIDQAEWLAERTCDQCGQPGTLRPKGWLVTRCEEHK